MKMTFRVAALGGVTVFLAVVVVAVFVPGLLWQPAQTIVAHPYTPEQELGRVTFYSNGCNYCHTQYVREVDSAMGSVSDGGDYVFDDPMILGSERTGPDLAYVGRKRSETWEVNHLKNPRMYSPLSIMPSFSFLSDEQLTAIAAYLFELGDRVAAPFMIRPPQPYQYVADPTLYPTAQPASGGQAIGWSTWTAAGLQTGKELYVDRCLTCHGCAGNGLGTYGGTLVVTPIDYKQRPYRDMPDDQWFWHVSEGVPGTVMPTWKESLSEDERWNVIHYIQQIFSHPVIRLPDEGVPPADYAGLQNPIPLTEGNVDAGKQIFTRECIYCHGCAGRGDGPYIEGLLPTPPDFTDAQTFGTLSSPIFTDADYFWRISEGLPWTAMPAWKLRYSAEDRWKLVHYIRSTFSRTEQMPGEPKVPTGPPIYSEATMPTTASFERGRQLFLTNCALCHGLAGDGAGWDASHLDPPPSDFATLAGASVNGQMEGFFLTSISFGVGNSAMPTWSEIIPLDERWDLVKYITGAFISGKPVTGSVEGDGAVPAYMATLDRASWLAEGHMISETHGAALYGTYCATCHGSQGQGNGPGTQGNASGSPAPFPNGMSTAYTYARTWDGVPETDMYPFRWLLSEADIWDVVAYVEGLTGAGGQR